MNKKVKKSVSILVIIACLLIITITVLFFLKKVKHDDMPKKEEMLTEYVDFFDRLEKDVTLADGWCSGSVFGSTWRKDNCIYEDGILHLNIDKDIEGSSTKWSSAEYFTNKFAHYGTYSVRMKPIKSSGVVSSFFLFSSPGYYEGSVWDEIDIEFIGKDTTCVQFNYYTNGEGNHEYIYKLGFDASENFHNYGFKWSEKSISWLVDGKVVYTATDNIPTHPGRIMINTWVGTGVNEWLGEFNSKVPLSAEYDWIRYRKK